MLAAEQMVLEENEMLRNEGRRIGINEGKCIGVDEGIIKVAKEMIKNGVENEYIMKYTHLNKEKIEKLRSQMSKNI